VVGAGRNSLRAVAAFFFGMSAGANANESLFSTSPDNGPNLNRPKSYLTTITQQNDEMESIIVIYDFTIVILEVFRDF
jgi:hypothetical protein